MDEDSTQRSRMLQLCGRVTQSAPRVFILVIFPLLCLSFLSRFPSCQLVELTWLTTLGKSRTQLALPRYLAPNLSTK